MSHPFIIEREQLNNLYTIQRKSAKQVGDILGCAKPTVLKALTNFNIPRRKHNGISYDDPVVDHSFFKQWSPDMAYILGYIAADGFINKGGTGLMLTSKDKELLDFCKDRFRTDRSVVYKEDYSRKNPGRDIYTLYVPSKEICKDLNNLGLFYRKSLTMEFPDYLNEDYFWHYLRGYTDGDGWVSDPNSKESLRITFLGSSYFIQGLRTYISNFFFTKVPKARVQGKNKLIHSFSMRGLDAKHMLNYMYGNEFYGLSRKKDRALNHINKFKIKGND
jgi:hypothetical protein